MSGRREIPGQHGNRKVDRGNACAPHGQKIFAPADFAAMGSSAASEQEGFADLAFARVGAAVPMATWVA